MGPSYKQAVLALTQTFVDEYRRSGSTIAPTASDRASLFLLEQRLRMTDYLRPSMRIMTVLFDAAAVLRTGRTFHNASPEQRRRQVRAWRLRVGARSAFIRFWESLTLFALFSEWGAGL